MRTPQEQINAAVGRPCVVNLLREREGEEGTPSLESSRRSEEGVERGEG